MILEVKDLQKNYKRNHVLKGINFSIEEPKIIALVGPNGSGKTTLLNCITNLISFQAGEINIFGKKNDDPNLFHQMSYLQDNRVLYDNLTGYAHLKFVCGVQKLPIEKVEAVAKRVGMEAYLTDKVKSYSLGMKQHLLLAMAMINDPKLLLLDEPLNGLDPTSAITVRNILLELYNEGTTIIISSHILGEIDRLTNNIYFMKDGTILQESLQDLSVNKYMLTVSDIKKAEKIIQREQLPISIEAKKVNFSEENISLEHVINYLYKENVSIKSVDKESIGAERRYQELFERKQTL